MTTFLEMHNVSFSYGSKEVLKGLNLKVSEGETISIIGESGVGKTTLFNIIAGTLNPLTGSIVLNNENISGQTGKVSYMLQKDLLMSHKTILQNVSLPLILKKMTKKEAYTMASKLFLDFGIEGSQDDYPSQLSGGMRQRAALLRTYLFGSDVMLLDEPFSALDPLTKTKMHTWYRGVMEKIKPTTVFITHDVDEALYLSDKIYVLKGSPAALVGPIEVTIERTNLMEASVTEGFIETKKRILNELR